MRLGGAEAQAADTLRNKPGEDVGRVAKNAARVTDHAQVRHVGVRDTGADPHQPPPAVTDRSTYRIVEINGLNVLALTLSSFAIR